LPTNDTTNDTTDTAAAPDVSDTEIPVPQLAHTHRDGCQTFRFAVFQWCVTHLDELLDAEPRLARTVEVDITGVDSMLGLGYEPGQGISLLRVEVNHDYAMTTDLSQPPLLARLITEDGRDYDNIFVDGWHRLYRARIEGRTSLTVRHVAAHAARAVLMPIFLR
jgi:hypothetical protein